MSVHGCLSPRRGRRAAAVMAEEPLLAQPLAVHLSEAEEPGERSPPLIATLHVSRAVLESAEYFRVILSERWSRTMVQGLESETLLLQLPPGCSLKAAQQLFLRLYSPSKDAGASGATGFDWGKISIGRILELVQLADMLMLSPPLVEELRQLLRSVVCCAEDVAELQRRCTAVNMPAWVEQLAGIAAGETQHNLSAALPEEQLQELMHAVCNTNNPISVKALERILLNRGRTSASHALRVAELLAGILESREHLQDEETIFGIKRTFKDGGHSFLGVAATFLEAFPHHMETISRVLFSPLAQERAGSPQSPLVSPYREIVTLLLNIAPDAEVPHLLLCIVEGGHFDAVDAGPLAHAIGRICPTAQVETCRVLAMLLKALEVHGTWRVFQSVVNSVVPTLCAAAQVELATALCELSADLQYQLINESLLHSMCAEAQVKLCKAFSQLDVRRVHVAACATVLSCLCPAARQLFCIVLVPHIHVLEPDVQKIILTEIEGSDLGSASAYAAECPEPSETVTAAQVGIVNMFATRRAMACVFLSLPLILLLRVVVQRRD
mmetsp:Transcript_85451/g.147701  ORF Transcript_85451/g.147701 Transcript_85451/m.147701 type:complete len:555 (-) Transcript_85451:22-1686(-)